jgi:hypothetical protein
MNPSKRVVDRIRDATAVVASAETNAVAVGRGLRATFEEHLVEGEVLPDWTLVVRLIGRVLDARAAQLAQADVRYQTELVDDDAPRANRDKVASELQSRVSEIREILVGVYGATQIERYGSRGATPREGPALVAFVTAMANRLRDQPLPTPRVKVALDQRALADELLARVPEVEATLDRVARERRRAQAALIARDAAMDTLDGTFSNMASALTALYRIGGQAKLAARVRPSSKRPGRLVEPEEPAEAASDTEEAPSADGG